MHRARCVLLAAMGLAAAGTGCAARLSDDMFRLDELAPGERAAIEQDRRHAPSGGTTSVVQQPRFVYLQGALVDTNRERWYWIAGGPLAPPDDGTGTQARPAAETPLPERAVHPEGNP